MRDRFNEITLAICTVCAVISWAVLGVFYGAVVIGFLGMWLE